MIKIDSADSILYERISFVAIHPTRTITRIQIEIYRTTCRCRSNQLARTSGLCVYEEIHVGNPARTARLDISVDLLLSEIISSQLTGRSLWESPYWTPDDDSPLRPQIRTAREHLTDFSNWPC